MAKASSKTSAALRAASLTFVCELPLKVTGVDEAVLLSRLEAARQIYNACLDEALRRVNLIRQSKDFNRAKTLRASNPERKALFKRKEFADALNCSSTKIRKLQRKMDRSRRATNPSNYNSNGTVKKGRKQWNSSKSYLKTRNAASNLERKLAAHRKSLHGELVNNILKNGDVIKLEKLSYKAFQKLFGSSVGRKAPGMFVSHLKSKAERAGSQVIEIPTYSAKLSQTCQCGRVKKKTLKERVHNCVCGVTAQRDLYSAFLAKHIEPDTFVLQVSQLYEDWQSVESRLQAAWRTATETKPATRRTSPSSFGRCPEVERVAAEVFNKTSKSQDVVAVTREPGRGCWTKEPPG